MQAALASSPFYNEPVLPPLLQEMECHILAPNGDVVLVAHKTYLKVAITVSSTVLGLASKVFRTLFGPDYTEGQGLGDPELGPKTLTMQDDAPGSLVLLCRIMHHQYSPAEAAKLGVDDIARLSVVADKYDCSAALAFFTQAAFEKYKDGEDEAWDVFNCDAKMVMAAYYLDSAEYFSLFTAKLVMGSEPETERSGFLSMGMLADILPLEDLCESLFFFLPSCLPPPLLPC